MLANNVGSAFAAESAGQPDVDDVSTEAFMDSDVAPGECVVSQNVLSMEDRVDLTTKKAQFDQVIGQADTTFEIEQVLIGASVEHDGVRYVATDNMSLVPVTDLIADLHAAEEAVYDAVDAIEDADDIALMEFALPDSVKDITQLASNFAEQLRTVAQLSYQYNNPTDLGTLEQDFSSVETHEVGGYEYSIHTVSPDKFGIDAEDEVKVIVPGFATTAETYERMAIDMALNGYKVSVIDLATQDIKIEDQRFDDLGTLVQSYAAVAEDGIGAVAQWSQKDVHVVGYSLGTMGATAAVSQGMENVGSLTLINPVGLYDGNMTDISQAARLISDTLSTHSAQVAEMKDQNDYARSIHTDTANDVAHRFAQDFDSGVSLNMFKMGSAWDIAQGDIADYLSKVNVPTTIIAFDQDAMAPLSEATDAAAHAGIGVHEMSGSHSTMKYQPGRIAEQLVMLSAN